MASGQSCALNCCDDDWVGFQGSCYLFGNGKPVHYTEAEHYCNQLGAHLVTIESSTENAFVRDYSSRLIKNYLWIGLTDVMIEGVWKWKSSRSLATFTDWNPGQPDNYHDEDCVHIHPAYSWHWNDALCTENQYPLCEKNITAPSLEVIG